MVDELEKKLESYRILVENTPDLLYRCDLEGRITFVSPSVEELSGYTVDEAIGMKMAEEVYLHPDERSQFLEQLQKEGRVKNFQARLKRKDGTIWWASTNAHFYKDKKGNIVGVEGITRDVNDIKKAEEAQRRSEELYRVAFKTNPDSINLNRASDGLFIDINEGFTKTTGYSRADVIGRNPNTLNIWRRPEQREQLVHALKEKGHVKNLQAEFVCKNGQVRVGLMSAKLIERDGEQLILSITRDITERLQLEQQFLQAQKLEALGTLAGGIAHDFNNLLMGIQGRASLIRVLLGSDHPALEHALGIEEYVRSASNLTKQILGFARGGKYEPTLTDINELLHKCGSMFGRTNKDIRLQFITLPEPAVAEVDRQQIEQVLLNIFVNAQQAMPRGGDLFLETSINDLAASFCTTHNIAVGRYIKISITDTGTGMDERTQQKAFDPFFTTKEKGRGTGLGLACVQGIVKNHNGAITLTSEVDSGTSVDIYLPFSELSPKKEEPPDSEISPGRGTILLVDDELLVTEVGKTMLETLGYNVFVADSGAEALEFLVSEGKHIDLVILDLIMPDMDGEKTFSAIHSTQPELPVLLSSGYSLQEQASEILKKGCSGFIQKPFTLSQLSKKLQEILNS